jgi:hypothetical protein
VSNLNYFTLKIKTGERVTLGPPQHQYRKAQLQGTAMARKDEAGQYLLEGLTPQQIQIRMGIGLNSICQYLCTLVGDGTFYARILLSALPKDI